MSFSHAVKMHDELTEQNIIGDCYATSLDSILQDKDLSAGFYYDIVAAQGSQNPKKFEELVRKQVAKHFREDHFTFDIIGHLSAYFAPDGNPLNWDEPSDAYEVVPPDLAPWIRRQAESEWERVYDFRIGEETEAERLERARSAQIDLYERFGIFVVTRNMILDGVSPMPISLQSREGDSHVFAVTHNGLDDIHVVDTAVPEDTTEEIPRPLLRSPHLDLEWLCSLDGSLEELPEQLDIFGNPYSRITDSNIPIEKDYWKYAVYPVPPSK